MWMDDVDEYNTIHNRLYPMFSTGTHPSVVYVFRPYIIICWIKGKISKTLLSSGKRVNDLSMVLLSVWILHYLKNIAHAVYATDTLKVHR
jgi:hypothetical protein